MINYFPNLKKEIKQAELLLNYNNIGFFELNSIYLLSCLIDINNGFDNINKEIDINSLCNDKKYSKPLSAFKMALEVEADVQLHHMKYDVISLLTKRDYIKNSTESI